MSTMPALSEEWAAPEAPETGALVELVHPMIGFEASSRYVIRPLGGEFGAYALMTSVEVNGLTFVVVPPGVLYPDYRFEIADGDVALLGLTEAADVETWVVITRKGVPVPTANLLGPIVVNRRTRAGAQLVLQDSGYEVAVPVNAGTAHPPA